MESEIDNDISLFSAINENNFDMVSKLLQNNIEPSSGFRSLPQNFKIFGVLPIPYTFLCALNKNYDMLMLFVDNKVSLDITDGFDNTLLHAAAYYGFDEVVHLFFDNNLSIDYMNKVKSQPIHIACERGNINFVRSIIDLYKDINVKNDYNRTPLFFASKNGNIELVKLLVNHNANSVISDLDGNTSVHIAISNNKLDVAYYLLENTKFPINCTNLNFENILLLSIKTKNIDFIKYLISKGCNTSVENRFGQNILHYAAKTGDENLVLFCMQVSTFPIDSLDIFNLSAIHYSIKSNSIKCVYALLNMSNSLLDCDYSGIPLIHIACKKGNLEIIKLLITQASFNPFVINKHNQTPLHVISRSSNKEVLSLLLQQNYWDVNIPDKNGFTPLHFAAIKGSREVFIMLMQHGALLNSVSDDGRTPKDILKHRKSTNILKECS